MDRKLADDVTHFDGGGPPAEPEGQAAPAGRPTWRRQPSTVALQVVPLFCLALTVVQSTIRHVLTAPARTGDLVLVISGGLLCLVGTGLLVADTARTRVRLAEHGVEIRRWRTTVHPYGSIVDVRVDRGSGDRTIAVRLNDGRSITLPAPTRGLTRNARARFEAAVALMRERCGLGSSPPHLP